VITERRIRELEAERDRLQATASEREHDRLTSIDKELAQLRPRPRPLSAGQDAESINRFIAFSRSAPALGR